MNTMSKSKHIVVIGAGLGGLSAAIMLARLMMPEGFKSDKGAVSLHLDNPPSSTMDAIAQGTAAKVHHEDFAGGRLDQIGVARALQFHIGPVARGKDVGLRMQLIRSQQFA